MSERASPRAGPWANAHDFQPDIQVTEELAYLDQQDERRVKELMDHPRDMHSRAPGAI